MKKIILSLFLTLISTKEELNIARFSNLEKLTWYDSDKIQGQKFEEEQFKVEMKIWKCGAFLLQLKPP